jgi:hypothetical protein
MKEQEEKRKRRFNNTNTDSSMLRMIKLSNS